MTEKLCRSCFAPAQYQNEAGFWCTPHAPEGAQFIGVPPPVASDTEVTEVQREEAPALKVIKNLRFLKPAEQQESRQQELHEKFLAAGPELLKGANQAIMISLDDSGHVRMAYMSDSKLSILGLLHLALDTTIKHLP